MKWYGWLLLAVASLWLTSLSFAQDAMQNKEMPSTEVGDSMNSMMTTNSENMMDEPENLDEDSNLADDSKEDTNETTPQALAIIEGTSEDSELYGEVELTDTPQGLLVNAEMYNATPGKHGFHIHENGSCDDKGNAAGSHFNPTNAQHGDLVKDGAGKAHNGDMGNIEINQEGEGTLSLTLPGVTVASVTGKSIIFHEKEDDFSQPTGNSGSRVGCGVIEAITEE